MITNFPFGFAFRHRIYFNPFIRRGHVKLWSSYEGKLSGKDPNKLGRNFMSELFAGEYSKLGTTRHTTILMGKDDDLLSLLAALEMAINGKKYTFENSEGRQVSFTPKQEENKEWEINVKIGSNKRTGKLLFDEAKTLKKFLKGFLVEIGYENEEVGENVKKEY